jgi:hypothetical protein
LSEIPAKTGANPLDYYAFIALALNLTYMAIAFNSWNSKQEYVILSQIIFYERIELIIHARR